MDPEANRTIGLDCHPDSFTAAVLRGENPAQAVVEKLFDHVPLAHLEKWALKHTQPGDTLVLEASGNSFHLARKLLALGRQAQVLESRQLGKLKEAHANNDKISAVRIAKAYLAGTAHVVWLPDPVSQERRDWMHAYRKVVKRHTQSTNRLLSYLSDQGVRLPKGQKLDPSPGGSQQLRQLQPWTPRQWLVIEGLLMDVRQAEEQREYWRSLMAQEVASDPLLLSLVRLCGIRDVVAFALGAVIGDIRRFGGPEKLVNYLGLNPSYDHSGKGQWEGGLGPQRGRRDVRSLLVESAHSIMRSKHPLARWATRLLKRKGEVNLVACAVARKLAVAVWYLYQGKWTSLEEIDDALDLKVRKIAAQVDPSALHTLGLDRRQLCQNMRQSLLGKRIYHLNPHKKWEPKTATPASG
jgi:transposase